MTRNFAACVRYDVLGRTLTAALVLLTTSLAAFPAQQSEDASEPAQPAAGQALLSHKTLRPMLVKRTPQRRPIQMPYRRPPMSVMAG